MGTLHGLMRVRGFVQDDAHIFCTEDQIQSEVAAFIELLHTVYEDFGFTDIFTKLSTRPEQRVGSDEQWDKAEAALQACLEAAELPFDWQLQPGEGAFYGPKIEFSAAKIASTASGSWAQSSWISPCRSVSVRPLHCRGQQ